LVAHLDLDTLTVVQTSFIDAQFTQSEADLLFSVSGHKRQGAVLGLVPHPQAANAS